MKLKIVSNGTSMGTYLTDSETGQRIGGVTHINVVLDAGGIAVAEITVRGVELDLENINTKVQTIDPETGLHVTLVDWEKPT